MTPVPAWDGEHPEHREYPFASWNGTAPIDACLGAEPPPTVPGRQPAYQPCLRIMAIIQLRRRHRRVVSDYRRKLVAGTYGSEGGVGAPPGRYGLRIVAGARFRTSIWLRQPSSIARPGTRPMSSLASTNPFPTGKQRRWRDRVGCDSPWFTSQCKRCDPSALRSGWTMSRRHRCPVQANFAKSRLTLRVVARDRLIGEEDSCLLTDSAAAVPGLARSPDAPRRRRANRGRAAAAHQLALACWVEDHAPG